MALLMIFFYIVLGFILFVILNYLDNKKQDNFFDYIIITNIYILVLSGLFKNIHDNIFLVVIFSNIFNILYISYVKEITFIKSGKYNIIKYLINIIISYLLNVYFINKIDSVFLNPQELRLIIWFIIILYLYKNVRNLVKLKDNKLKFYQDREYIVMRYAKYKNKYNNIIHSKYKDINLLVYAIMIYENYQRNEVIRKFDEIMYRLFSKKCCFGIMQISSKKLLSDSESIKVSIRVLSKLYQSNKGNIKFVINRYYKGMNREVYNIYLIIKDFIN